MKIFFKIISYLFIVAISIIALLLVVSALPGGLDVKVVKSGSMEPTIKTGAIIAIRPASSYEVGDIITFGEDTKTQIPTTHRIIGVQTSGTSTGFLTKGDANDSADPRVIEKREVKGKMLFTIPYLGFVLDFARKPVGFMLLVGVPALILIVDEVRKVIREVKSMRRKKRRDGSGDDFTPPDTSFDNRESAFVARDVSSESVRKSALLRRGTAFDRLMPGFFLALQLRQQKARALKQRKVMLSGIRSIVIVLVAYGAFSGLFLLGGTVSYFSDQELTVGNLLRAGVVDFRLVSTDSNLQARFAVLPVIDDETNELSDEDPVKEEPPVETPAGTTTFSLAIEGGETALPLIYSLSGALDEGMPEVCGTLTLDASYGENEYAGPLVAFKADGLSTLGSMTFTVTLPDAESIDWATTCGGAITVAAHIEGVSDEIDSLFGDSESFPFSVSGEKVPVLPPIPLAPDPVEDPDPTPDPGEGGGGEETPPPADLPPAPPTEEVDTPPESSEPAPSEETAPPEESAPSEPTQ